MPGATDRARAGRPVRRQPGRAFGALLLAACGVLAAEEPPGELLKKADAIRTSDFAGFNAIIDRFDDQALELAPRERDYLRYLRGWRHGYRGEFEQAIPDLRAVIDSAADTTLKFRASASIVNALTIAKHYVDAYTELERLRELLPQVTDAAAREQGLVVTAIHYNQVGQYDLAAESAQRLITERNGPSSECKGTQLLLEGRFKQAAAFPDLAEFARGASACEQVGEPIYASLIRTYAARALLARDDAAAARELLRSALPKAQATRYPRLISEFESLLAQASWKLGDAESATELARAAVEHAVPNEFTEPLAAAYGVLAESAARRGDYETAYVFRGKHAAADKAYLDNESARQLAFQMVRSDAAAKKAQIEALSKANQVLQLSEQLSVKSAENFRLYVVLLLTLVVFILYWTWRTKRSQLHYKQLAQRDGLTGIANRPHFVAESEHALAYCKKSGREVCAILLDLDHFKRVNDQHGHAVGDLVLKRAVAACAAPLRSVDLFGRLGGEEFGIVLPDCSLEAAHERAEQLRAAIAALHGPDGEFAFPVSASFGVGSTRLSGYELRQLIADADEALYRAKAAGRDRVELFARAAA